MSAASSDFERLADDAASLRRALLAVSRGGGVAALRDMPHGDSERARAGAAARELAAAMRALAECGEAAAAREHWDRAAKPGASGVRPCVAALQRLAVELLAGADVAAEKPSPQLVGAVEELVDGGDKLEGNELFGYRVLSSGKKKGGRAAAAACGAGAGAADDARERAAARESAARERAIKFWYKEDLDALVAGSRGAAAWSPARCKKETAGTPESLAAAMLSPPAANERDLDAVFDDCFARVGSWNILGNAAFRGSAAAAAAVATATAAAPFAAADAVSGAKALARTKKAAKDASAVASSLGKAESLTKIIHRENWSAVALQELPVGNTLDALMRGSPLAAHWAFVSSACVGPGMSTGKVAAGGANGEVAAFGYDRRAWVVVDGPAVVGDPAAPLLRRPAALVLRSRLHPRRRLALVSVHLQPERASAEAAALAGVVAAWWAAACEAAAANGHSLCAALLGDFNLASAFAGAALAAAGFAPADGGGAPTNVHDFAEAPQRRELDAALVRATWPARAAAAAVDIARAQAPHHHCDVGCLDDCQYSALATCLDAAARAVAAMPDDADTQRAPLVRDFVAKTRNMLKGLRGAAVADFRSAWSDHRPITLVIGQPPLDDAEAAAAGAGDAVARCGLFLGLTPASHG